MSIKMEQIMPEFEKLRMTEVKGQRLINTVTFNPDRAEPGEEIYVTIPKLKPGVCIVPNSLYLRARFKNKNTKSWFLNNLGKLLVEELRGGELLQGLRRLMEIQQGENQHGRLWDSQPEHKEADVEGRQRRLDSEGGCVDERHHRQQRKDQAWTNPQQPRSLCSIRYEQRHTIQDQTTQGRHHHDGTE